MSKIKEYRKLSENVKNAKINFKELGQDLVSRQDVYDLGGTNVLDKCINKFNRVKLPNGQINDEGGMTICCEHLYENRAFCDVYGCGLAKQYYRFRYIKLKQELDEAIAARRAFVRNLFKFNRSK